jgi:CheY-like chemotaxis protein
MGTPQTLVAVINNDAVFVRLLDTLLRDEHYDTLLLQIGDIAYESIKQQRPRLVILDISSEVPNESWRLVDLLRLDPETAAIPVLVCSVADQSLHARRPKLEATPYTFIEKPFTITELMEAVHAALDATAP